MALHPFSNHFFGQGALVHGSIGIIGPMLQFLIQVRFMGLIVTRQTPVYLGHIIQSAGSAISTSLAIGKMSVFSLYYWWFCPQLLTPWLLTQTCPTSDHIPAHSPVCLLPTSFYCPPYNHLCWSLFRLVIPPRLMPMLLLGPVWVLWSTPSVFKPYSRF